MIRPYCCVIPVFSNDNFAVVREVISRTRLVTPHILVIDDASGHNELEEICKNQTVELIRHETSGGLCSIFQTALSLLSRRGIAYMITIDQTGQCYPEDLPRFLSYLHQKEPATITLGCRDFIVPPGKKLSDRKLRNAANFLFRLETGLQTSDADSNFCMYPVHFIKRLKINPSSQNYRTELLTKAIWANAEIRSLRIRFTPRDTASTSPLNIQIHFKLIGLRLLPCKKQTLRSKEKFEFSILRPKQFFAYLLKENATPGELAAAAFTGTYCAVLPLFGLHTPVVLYFATVFRLNKFLAFMIQHPFVLLPITPFLCIELGYLMRHGQWLTDISLQTVFYEIHFRILEWLLGSLVLAPVFAVLSAVITYFSAAYLQKKIRLKFWAKQRKILTENKTEPKE